MKIDSNYSINTNSKLPKQQQAKNEGSKKLAVALCSVATTVLPLIAIRHFQGKSLNKDVFKTMDLKQKGMALLKSFNIEYGLKEMLLVSTSSVIGGLASGLLLDKEENNKAKFKEATVKISNVAIPTTLVSGVLYAMKALKAKGPLPKITSIILGVGLGMPIANKISNKVNKIFIDKDNAKERKLKPKDYLVHIDDFASVLILSKVPFASKLHLDKLLSAIYVFGGYEVGTSKKND